MKIRTSFVSNSSSSSFVVALPHKPKDSTDLAQILFGEKTFYPNPYPGSGSPIGFSAAVTAKTLFDLIDGKAKDKDVIEEIVSELRYTIHNLIEDSSNCFRINNDGSISSMFMLAKEDIREKINILKKIDPKKDWINYFNKLIEKMKILKDKKEKASKAYHAFVNAETKRRKAQTAYELMPNYNEQNASEEDKKRYKAASKAHDRILEKIYAMSEYKKLNEEQRILFDMFYERNDKKGEINHIAGLLWKHWKKEHKGFIIKVELGDENGQLQSAMEHGTLFENLPSMTFSHH